MTLKQLSKYYKLKTKLAKYEEALECLRSASEAAATPKLTAMPKSMGVSNKTARFVAQITYLEDGIKKIRRDMAHEFAVVSAYIDAIEDAFVKTIFSLRFIEGLSWGDIAELLGADDDSVKRACYRYLD